MEKKGHSTMTNCDAGLQNAQKAKVVYSGNGAHLLPPQCVHQSLTNNTYLYG